MLLVFVVFEAAAAISIDKIEDYLDDEIINSSANVSFDDELDQYQTTMEVAIPVGHYAYGYNFMVAQSFKPEKSMLTRVQLLIGRNITTTQPINLVIRENFSTNILVHKSINAEEIPVMNDFSDLTWIEFDFKDIPVTKGQTYYIICYCYTEDIADNFYFWGGNGTGNPYLNGSMYWSEDYGETWKIDPDLNDDTCFKTFGNEGTELNIVVTGGLGVSMVIHNIGEINATNVEYNIHITGGIFNLINISDSGTIIELEPDPRYITEMGYGTIGLGPIRITATARADNAEMVEYSVEGTIIIIFVFLPHYLT